MKTLNCDADLCEDDEPACDDESGLLDEEGDGYWSLVSKRSYRLRNGKVMHGYGKPFFEERGAGIRPGDPRSFKMAINTILGVSKVYTDNYLIWTRAYPPGLGLFKGDGASTLSMKGGFR
jgi:chitinase